MKRISLLFTLIGGILPALSLAQLPKSIHEPYKLVWSDDFTGTSLDITKWDYRTGKRLLSVQRPENVSVEGGNLVISLLSGPDHTYTAGGVISRASFRYGYYEARVKILAGNGWHSSFWMMRTKGPGPGLDDATIELDAMENTSNNLHSYSVNVHRWAPPHRQQGSFNVKTTDLSKSFHVIGCEYSPGLVRYYLDGKLVDTVPWAGEPQGNVNVWLTSVAEAMGPQHNVDDAATPGKMLVDWVRVYAK
jgi:beta-glucanase (GH16 family)